MAQNPFIHQYNPTPDQYIVKDICTSKFVRAARSVTAIQKCLLIPVGLVGSFFGCSSS